jgi:tricarballylate dehydrogenase
MLNALYRTAEELGVDILYNAEVIDLNIEHGMFLSAQLKQPVGGRTEVRASTLVAAAGGFEANIEWLKQYWGEAADNFLIRGTPYNRGTILKMLLAKGVQEIGDPTQCHAVAIDARAPKFDGGIITRHDSVVFGIVVNKHAERFYDEGEDIWPKRYAIWGRLVAAQPDQIAYIIFDSTVVTSFMPTLFPPSSPASSNSTPPRWKRPSPNSTPRCSLAPSITPSSTTAVPKASRRPRRIGRARSRRRPISPIRCGPALPSPISAPA